MVRMHCNECGTKFDESLYACPQCGSSNIECDELCESTGIEYTEPTASETDSVIDITRQDTQDNPTLETDEPISYDENNDVKNKRKWVWAVIGIIALTLVAGGGFIVYKNINSNAVSADTIQSDTIVAVVEVEDSIVHITPEFIQAVQKYDELGVFSDKRAYAKRNGKYGFINVHGEEVIPCQYDEVTTFREGKASVKLNGRWGYINVKGDVVIPFFDAVYAEHFSEGRAYIIKEIIEDGFSNKYVFIDERGTTVFGGSSYHDGLPEIYPTTSFRNGVVKICYDSSFNEVIYDKQGRQVQQDIQQDYSGIQDDYEIFTKDDGNDRIKYRGLQDSDGNIVIPAKYHDIHEDYRYPIVSCGVVLVSYCSDDVDDYFVGEGGTLFSSKNYYGYADLYGNDTFAESLKQRCDETRKRVSKKYEDEWDKSNLIGAWYTSTSAGQMVMVFKDDGVMTIYFDGGEIPPLKYNYDISGGVVTFDNGKGHMRFRDHRILVGADGTEFQQISSDSNYVPEYACSQSSSSRSSSYDFTTAASVMGWLSGKIFVSSNNATVRISAQGVWVNNHCISGAPRVTNIKSYKALIRYTPFVGGGEGGFIISPHDDRIIDAVDGTSYYLK